MKMHRSVLSMLFVALACAPFAIPAHAEEPAKASEYVKPEIKHAPYGDIKFVVPVTTNDTGIQGMKMRNIANAMKAEKAWHGKFHFTVVMYAKGTSLVKDPSDAIKKQIDTLRAEGVHFVICNNSLEEQGLDFHKLYGIKDADVVPSGFAEVAYLQAKEHYVIDPVD